MLGWFAVACSCESINSIRIESPEPGSFFTAGQEIEVQVTTKESPITVNGTKYSGKSFTAVLPPVDGLGFIKASKKGDPLFTVRSYLQGVFRDIADFQSQTVQTRLGIDILQNRDVSFASICEEMMAGEELVSYMDNPIVVETEIAFIPVTIEVTTTSVVAESIEVTMHFEGDTLYFHSRLSNVLIYYNSKAAGISGSGQALYDWMEIDGELVLSVGDSDLINMSATASAPHITDDGGVPEEAFGLIIDKLDVAVQDAIIVTTRNSSRIVFNTMMSTLVPQVVLEFENPILQQTRAQTMDILDGNIQLAYETKIQAETPLLAGPQAGVLERFHRDAEREDGMSITFGSALVNQIAFAMWDAGNANGKIYTKQQLYDLGMEKLGGYYDRLKTSQIDLLLPPVLEWDETGPWLVIGGIEITMKMDGAEDTLAHTAGRVPIYFEQRENAIVLLRDESRGVFFYDVGFNRMSDLVDPSKVVRLLTTAVPGVVSDLFSTFPIVRMTSTMLPKLNGDPGPSVLTTLLGITTHDGFWRLDLGFEKL
ncbi:MAG: hypothetical protein CVU65_01270 [Deltaproteobacteria bacterium HGW-Deltaproteobacteria-22]|nr:MAG: hypothetical protein CVU65_01270 [Deltaproteobacteria bacterium HGW-Deltaproteobacteria-22]